jgi:hypothetical protein
MNAKTFMEKQKEAYLPYAFPGTFCVMFVEEFPLN